MSRRPPTPEMGFQMAIGQVRDVWRLTPLEVIGSKVIPAVASLNA